MKTTRDIFSSYHPIINFTFFAGAFLFGMLLMHPIYQICSMIFAGAYYITIKKGSGVKWILGMVPLFLVLSVINGFFNPLGDTVLFTYFQGRNFTFEALCYGFSMAALFVAIIGWFASYNAVMTSDKFLYLFGKWIPSLSLVFTMVLRFVPSYQKRLTQMGGARKCIGKSMGNGTNREKMENGLTLVSALTTWALEGGIITADSMRSRGFGEGKRTSFSIYKWEMRDALLMILMLVCMGVLVVCIIFGGTSAEFIPAISMEMNSFTIIGLFFYVIFLGIPTAMNIWEEMIWHILRSKI